MKQTFRKLAALLLAAFLLTAGNGLQGSLLAVRADLESFPLSLVGLLTSGYFIGFIAGCRNAPRLVARVGHIRTFTALASLASAGALGHILAVNPVAWILLRAVTGFALAGLYMVIESWINENASNSNRGRVLAVYRFGDLTAATAGQALLMTAAPSGFHLFALVSILISLALVPVALTASPAPQPIEVVKIDLKRLFQLSPLAMAGSLGVGFANGAFWALGPVFVQRLGQPTEAIGLFMVSVVVAGALSQWPLGLLSDRVDRRIIIIATAGGAAIGSGLAVAASLAGIGFLPAGAICFGLFSMPLFGLAIAHANDRAERREIVVVSAGLLMLYGIGAVAGPPLGALAMSAFGPPALFVLTGSAYFLIGIYGAVRLVLRDRVKDADRAAFVSVPRTSPVVFEIDPRVPEEQRSYAPQDEDGAGSARPE